MKFKNHNHRKGFFAALRKASGKSYKAVENRVKKDIDNYKAEKARERVAIQEIRVKAKEAALQEREKLAIKSAIQKERLRATRADRWSKAAERSFKKVIKKL